MKKLLAVALLSLFTLRSMAGDIPPNPIRFTNTIDFTVSNLQGKVFQVQSVILSLDSAKPMTGTVYLVSGPVTSVVWTANSSSVKDMYWAVPYGSGFALRDNETLRVNVYTNFPTYVIVRGAAVFPK